ncbi:hypothetical protein FKM82_021464 [Ascaphus truei]
MPPPPRALHNSPLPAGNSHGLGVCLRAPSAQDGAPRDLGERHNTLPFPPTSLTSPSHSPPTIPSPLSPPLTPLLITFTPPHLPSPPLLHPPSHLPPPPHPPLHPSLLHPPPSFHPPAHLPHSPPLHPPLPPLLPSPPPHTPTFNTPLHPPFPPAPPPSPPITVPSPPFPLPPPLPAPCPAPPLPTASSPLSLPTFPPTPPRPSNPPLFYSLSQIHTSKTSPHPRTTWQDATPSPPNHSFSHLPITFSSPPSFASLPSPHPHPIPSYAETSNPLTHPPLTPPPHYSSPTHIIFPSPTEPCFIHPQLFIILLLPQFNRTTQPCASNQKATSTLAHPITRPYVPPPPTHQPCNLSYPNP